jgi:transcriptional regulator with XRE-family HTH domain
MSWQTETERLSVLLEMAEQLQRVAARLKRLRQEQGDNGKALSQEDAAARAGLRTRQWQRWEAAQNMPRPSSLEQIADAFGIGVEEFYEAPGDQTMRQPSQFDRIEAKLDELLSRLPESDPAEELELELQDAALEREQRDAGIGASAPYQHPRRRAQ